MYVVLVKMFNMCRSCDDGSTHLGNFNYPFENVLTVTDLVNFDVVNVHQKTDYGEWFWLFCCRCDGYKIILCSLFIAWIISLFSMRYLPQFQFLICIVQILYFEGYKFLIFIFLLLNTHIGSLTLRPYLIWGHKLFPRKHVWTCLLNSI